LETPELLVGAGVKYIGDWVYDDEPTVIRTAKGPLVTLPYTVELNDIPMMIVQHHESDYLYKRAVDQFDRLYAEGKDRAKIMALAIHPYISGQPHRIKYLEAIYDYVNRFEGVLHWNGEEILDWYRSASARTKRAAASGAPSGFFPLSQALVCPLDGLFGGNVGETGCRYRLYAERLQQLPSAFSRIVGGGEARRARRRGIADRVPDHFAR
jgi:hypothetical protein